MKINVFKNENYLGDTKYDFYGELSYNHKDDNGTYSLTFKNKDICNLKFNCISFVAKSMDEIICLMEINKFERIEIKKI